MSIGHLLARSALFHPWSPGVEDARRTVTYGELAAEVHRLTTGLGTLGVRRGDRIAVMAKNRIEYVALLFAVADLGAVTVPVNWRLGAGEVEYILRDSGATVVVAEPAFAVIIESASALLPDLRHKIGLDEGLPGWTPFAQMAMATPARHRSSVTPDDVAIQMYTSGTTGKPKGALLTHRNLTSLTSAWLLDMPLSPRSDRFLQVTPLYHVGAVLMVMSNVAVGSQLMLLPEFAPGPAAEALAERGVTKALFVPAMIRWLLADPGVSGQKFPDLGMIAYGAAPIPPQLLLDAFDVFDCDFVQGYGLTETSGVITTLRAEDHHRGDESRLASAGRAVLCSRVRVVDEEDQEVAPGTIGEIVAQGDNITPGYWNMADASADALRGGWFHTGDVGWMDDEGYITIVDRLKDMILVGGENVYPSEAEHALDGHPAVVESAVIGIPHDVWGEQLLALVVLDDGQSVTDRELIAHCRGQLAQFKCPTLVEFRDTLSRNAAGKLLKAELREPYWADRSRRV